MKQLLSLLLISLATSLNAQLMVVDFEDDGVGKPDCFHTAEWPGDPNAPVVSLEANPDSNATNNTPNCIKFVETMGSAAGNSLQLAFNASSAKTGHNLTTNKFVKFLVYSENQTNFDISLELGTGGTPHFSMTKSVSTSLNTWTEVEFDFSGNDTAATINNPTGWISNVRVHFNNGTAGQGDVYFVDEYFISPTSTIIIQPVLPILIVDFEDDGIGKPDCFPTAEWVNDPNVPIVTLEPNPDTTGINTTPNSVKYSETMGSAPGNSLQFAFNASTAKTGHDLIANKFVKFMVYSENQTNFDISLELGAGGTPHFSMTKSVSASLNTWTEVEFDFSGNDTAATINNPTGWISNVRVHFNNGVAGQGDIYFVDEYLISETSTIEDVFTNPTLLSPKDPIYTNYEVSGGLLKILDVEISSTGNYANFALYAGSKILVDHIDIPSSGTFNLNALVEFPQTGNIELKLVSTNSEINVQSFSLTDYQGVFYPSFIDITDSAGIVDEPSLKYGGPSIADMDNDGNYDLVLNNHNDSPSKLFMSNGNGTFSKPNPDLSLWNRMDLHGSAAGDYDNDGDLDLIIALGGGNGSNPQPPIFYKNNQGTLVRSETAVGITSGARGRSPRWSDLDLDGDLDLILINAAGVNGSNGEQHIFYENLGDGTFQPINVPGIEVAGAEKLLLTDFNNDHIDDIILFSPLSAWKGNGNFTFTNVSNQWLPSGVNGSWDITAITDIDIDNDGDLDLYLTKGQYYYWVAENNSADFNALTEKLDLRISGSQGTLPFEINANGSIIISKLDYTTRNAYAGGFPLYLGSALQKDSLANYDDTMVITQAMADGWSQVRADNGLYIGHVGNGVWKVEAVRNQNIFWSIHFSIDSVNAFIPTGWTPNNRNIQDVLLENDNQSFTNVSDQWNIPQGGNHWGVTRGDFNNDSYQDLYVYRFGYLKNRLADYMLLNTGQGEFKITSSHTASNVGSIDHGDMGQAFDYNNDGNVDILNGDDEFGLWHLYQNAGNSNNNYVLVKVEYSPNSKIDPISAAVSVFTATHTYHKRVGSAGETHSQSLLNIVHFGLGQETHIDSVVVRWRNGETMTISDESVNQMLTVSTPLSIDKTINSGFQLGEFYPNPSNDGMVKLDYSSIKKEKMNISIFDTTGKLIFKQLFQVETGNKVMNFNFSELARGLYVARIGNEVSSTYRKLVIE